MSDTEEEHTVDYSGLKKVLSAAEYDEICQFIRDYPGLAIDCEIDMVRNHFKHINPFTIKWIMQIELANRQRTLYWSYDQVAHNILERFEAEKWHCDSTFLLRMASVERISPVLLCRLILKEKFPEYSKVEISDALKYPREKIEDPLLATNVLNCVVSDSQDGALVDMRRRLVGEEYELKLKQMAKAAGLHFKDEHDLRRIGYDKTPDIRMVLPFLYKGEIVWWMESKAVFGDIATHMSYVEQQLKSYNNRFSNGIIIYWFGYHEQVPELTDKSLGVTILDDFPAQEHITLLDVKLLDVKPEDIKKGKDVKKDANEKDVEINNENDARKANQASSSDSPVSKLREKLSGFTVLDKVSNTPKYMSNEEFNEAGPILSADVEAKSDGKREQEIGEKITAEIESKPEEKEETFAKA